MNKSIFAVLLFCISILLAANTLAAVTLSEISLGSSSQNRGQAVSTTLTITNTNPTAATLTLAAVAGSQYQLTLNETTTTVAANSTKTLTVTGYVPTTQGAGRTLIGSITATGPGITATSNVYMTAQSMLEITKVRVTVDGDADSLDDGDDVEAKPGDEVTVEITVKNNFDQNIDIEDINVQIEQDDLDWDEEEEISDISDGDKETVEFTFTIDDDADDDNYDVDITVDGEDENNLDHEDDFSFTIEVDREQNELTIKQVSITPSVVSCDRTVTMIIESVNTGSKDLDRATLEVTNTKLGLTQMFSGIAVDSGKTVKRTFTFTVPQTVTPGVYPLDTWAYYDANKDHDTDTAIAELTVKACNGNGAATDDPATTKQCTNYNAQFCISDMAYQKCSTTGTLSAVQYCPSGTSCQAGQCITVQQMPQTGVSGPSFGERPFLESTEYFVLLVAVAVLLVALIIILLVKFVF